MTVLQKKKHTTTTKIIGELNLQPIGDHKNMNLKHQMRNDIMDNDSGIIKGNIF